MVRVSDADGVEQLEAVGELEAFEVGLASVLPTSLFARRVAISISP